MGVTVELQTVGRSLLKFVSARVADGQRQLAQFIGLKLSSSGHPAAALLDYSVGAPFLDPSLFAFFNEPEPAGTLDEILNGIPPVVKRAQFPGQTSNTPPDPIRSLCRSAAESVPDPPRTTLAIIRKRLPAPWR